MTRPAPAASPEQPAPGTVPDGGADPARTAHGDRDVRARRTGGPVTGALRVRPMGAADCDAVAAVRVRGWQYAYAGLVPKAFLDAMSVEADAARRRQLLAAGGTGGTDLVAERGGHVVGWACYGPARDSDVPQAALELYALYVLPEHLSSGVGQALLHEITGPAGAADRDLVLWVVAENARARRFYAKAGFSPDGAEESFEAGGVMVPEVRYSRRPSASNAAAPRRG